MMTSSRITLLNEFQWWITPEVVYLLTPRNIQLTNSAIMSQEAQRWACLSSVKRQVKLLADERLSIRILNTTFVQFPFDTEIIFVRSFGVAYSSTS